MSTEPLKTEQSPIRLKNIDMRDREHLTQSEINILLKHAKSKERTGDRNHLIIMLGYIHGLRAVEFTYLRWESIDFQKATIYIRRAKGSDSGTHHLSGTELRYLRKLRARQEFPSNYVFLGETGKPIAATAISGLIKRLGVIKTGYLLGFPIHAHMLRHTCGYLLAERGTDLRLIQSWLGHRQIQNTTIYTKLSSAAFKSINFD